MAILGRHSAAADTDMTDEKAPVGRAQVDERATARARLAERTATAERAVATKDDTRDTTIDVVAPAGPRPRTSMLAKLSLLTGAGAAFLVLTGLLAGPGVVFGVVAAFLGIAGMAATSRRHVAGKSDALLGIALGLAAVVIGVLAVTGTLPRLTGETNMVQTTHDWLIARLPWLFPST